MRKETIAYRAILLVTAIISVMMLVGCAKETEKPEGDVYVLNVGDVEISPGGEASLIIEKLGKPAFLSREKAGCGSNEIVCVYEYGSFKIKTVNINNRELIDTVTVTDDMLRTSKGITIGSQRKEVISAYGEDFLEYPTGIAYQKGRTTLNFSIKDDRVVLIYYDYEF
ncbi:MAG: hypothetical protein E7667_04705 [Ruminococcaceae bacterium]|nr:hypothetical protein [Oscillospiraceae bacterium]